MTASVLVLVLGGAAALAWAAVVVGLGASDDVDGGVAPDEARPVVLRGVVARLGVALADRGVDGDPGRWARVGAVAAVALVGLGLLRGGPVGAFVAAGAAGAAVLVAARATRGRGDRLADEHLPALLEHTSRGLRSGLDLRSAVASAVDRAGPHAPAVEAVVARVDGGSSWDDALAGWAGEAPRQPVRLVAAALALAAASGGGAARALDGVSATLRARRAVAQEARSLASQARASAAVLVALPVVVSVGGAAADPRLADALLGTSWGLGCVAAAVALDTAGALWMQRIVNGSAP